MHIPAKVVTKTGHSALVTVVQKGVFHFSGQASDGAPLEFDFIDKKLTADGNPLKHKKILQSFDGVQLEILQQFFKELEIQNPPI